MDIMIWISFVVAEKHKPGVDHLFSSLEQSRYPRADIDNTFVHHRILQPISISTTDLEFVELESMLLDRQQYLLPGSSNHTV
jgi:hypothetical protein